jgi:membrane protease YdiL (CAAX protease family)
MIDNSIMPAEAPRKQIWGGWATAGFGAVIIFVFVVVQSLVAAAYFVARMVTDPTLDIVDIAEKLISDGNLITAATIASAVVCSGLIFIIVKVRRGASFAEYLALKPLSKKSVFAVLVITVVFIGLSSLVNLFLERPVESDFMYDAYRSVTAVPLFWMALVVFGPVFEELFIRGFLFMGFVKSRLGPVGAVILTTLVWAALHFQYGIYEIVIIFFLGLILGVVRYKTGSLWASVIIHALNNLLAVLLVHLSVYYALD